MKFPFLNFSRKAPRLSASRASAGTADAQTRSLDAGAAAWLRGEGPDGAALSNAYEQVVWVYRAINVLAEQVANVPFRLSREAAGGEDLILQGPLVDFYARPHPQMDRFQYWELRVIWLMLRGECFRVPFFEREGTGRRRLKHVIIPDPAHFQHIVEDQQLVG